MNFLKLIPLLACILLVACSSPEERAANYIDKAEALYADEDYVGAKIEAMNAAQIEPRNADARYLLAQIEEKQQNFRGAIGHLQVAVDANPNHVESRIKLGNYYVLAKAADLAEEQSIAAMELDPENPEARLLKARVAYLNEDLVTARTEVDTALIQDPGLVDGIMFKAGIDMAEDNLEGALELVDNGIANANAEGIKNLRQFKILMLRASQRNEEVEAELQALIKAYPDDDGFLLALAQLYAVEDRIDEAEQTYRQYIDKAPDDVERRITFAQFVGAQDGPERAEETLQAFIEELPDETVLQLALGQLYETIDSKDEALVVYENIVAMDPVSTDGLKARNRIAIIKLQQDKPEEARTMAESIIVDKPDDPDALLMRAAFSFSDRNYDDAVTDLRTVIRVKPESERALLLLARSHRAAGNPELAQDAYRRLLDLNRANSGAATELAELLAKGGDVEQAQEVLRNQLEVEPGNLQAQSNLIQTLLLEGDIEGAENEARNMLADGDDTGLAEFELGRVMQAKRSNQEAIEAYKAALEKNPNAPQPLQGLIGTLVSDDRIDEAVEYLQAHLASNPTQITPRLLLGAIYSREDRTDEAITLYEEAIELRPAITRPYVALASLYPEGSNERRTAYRRAIAANPAEAGVSLLLAGDYERAGEYEEAITIYENLLAESPDNLIAANNLAALLLDFRDDEVSYAQALELAKSFQDSKQPALIDTLGWAYYRAGNYEVAVRYLEKAVAGASQVAQLHYHLGMALIKAGDVAQGKAELEESLSLAKNEFTGIDDARTTLAELG